MAFERYFKRRWTFSRRRSYFLIFRCASSLPCPSSSTAPGRLLCAGRGINRRAGETRPRPPRNGARDCFGLPFRDLQVRSMVMDAERNTFPSGRSAWRPRVTRIGRFSPPVPAERRRNSGTCCAVDMSLVGTPAGAATFVQSLTERSPTIPNDARPPWNYGPCPGQIAVRHLR